MRERVTYYVAAPIARRDDGAVRARQMAGSPFYVGA
jgi:hypothetical protein